MPFRMPKQVEYEPVPVRKLLLDMKNYASIMLDLAYFSAIYGDKRIAYEVLNVEDHIDRMWSLLVMQASLAVRDAKDAEEMVSVFRVGNALDKVSDAAADVASLVVREMAIHDAVRAGLLRGEEVMARIEVRRGSRLDGSSIAGVLGRKGIAMIMMLRRDNRWLLKPPPSIVLREGDVIIVRGTREILEDIAEAAGDRLPSPAEMRPAENEIAEKIAFLKDLSDVMLDLAFHSVIWSDRSAALEVLELEETMDDAIYKYLEMVSAAIAPSDPSGAVGLLKLGEAFEEIGDAATEMANIIASGLPIHEIIETAEEESVEQVLKAVAEQPTTVGSLELDELGAIVVAIKHRGRWHPLPPDSHLIEPGDELVVKYYAETEEDVMRRLHSHGFIVVEEEEE